MGCPCARRRRMTALRAPYELRGDRRRLKRTGEIYRPIMSSCAGYLHVNTRKNVNRAKSDAPASALAPDSGGRDGRPHALRAELWTYAVYAPRLRRARSGPMGR
ncbi:hypothetical protein EVAR_35940_1 [Eumeta japonica]|uniref:Uncharacterized protein n=1 Tax=Eumeta variegata TaxID=151549 RepID=A0A4C1W586_EUMVA|nr:hypothetical protein EVAR_35940_1 [Eumeta japonica]